MSVFRRMGVKYTLAVAVVMGGIGGAAAYVNTALPSWPPQPMPTPCSSYCYNVDIYNNTRFAANDLHVTVEGPTSFCSHYDGDKNPFGKPKVTTTGTTSTLDFAAPGASVKRGAFAHIGFCSNAPAVGVVSYSQTNLPAFYWTYNTQYAGDIIAVGHAWQAELSADGGVRPVIDLINNSGTPIHVRQVDWALVDEAIPLNELMWDGLADRLQWTQVAADGELAQGTNDAPSFLQMPLDKAFSADDPRHVVFRFWAENPGDPTNLNRGVAQVSIAELVRLAKNGNGTSDAK